MNKDLKYRTDWLYCIGCTERVNGDKDYTVYENKIYKYPVSSNDKQFENYVNSLYNCVSCNMYYNSYEKAEAYVMEKLAQRTKTKTIVGTFDEDSYEDIGMRRRNKWFVRLYKNVVRRLLLFRD